MSVERISRCRISSGVSPRAPSGRCCCSSTRRPDRFQPELGPSSCNLSRRTPARAASRCSSGKTARCRWPSPSAPGCSHESPQVICLIDGRVSGMPLTATSPFQRCGTCCRSRRGEGRRGGNELPAGNQSRRHPSASRSRRRSSTSTMPLSMSTRVRSCERACNPSVNRGNVLRSPHPDPLPQGARGFVPQSTERQPLFG